MEFASLIILRIIERARGVDVYLAPGEGVDFLGRKNEAILRRVVGNAFVFMEFGDGGGVLEVAFAVREALGLDRAEMIVSFLELAREARGVEAEHREIAHSLGDVDFHGLAGAFQQIGFEGGDAVEAPGGVGEFLGELGFDRGGRTALVEEMAAVLLVSGLVFGGQGRGAAQEAVAEGVLGRARFSFFGAGAGGMFGIGAIDGGAVDGWKS